MELDYNMKTITIGMYLLDSTFIRQHLSNIQKEVEAHMQAGLT